MKRGLIGIFVFLFLISSGVGINFTGKVIWDSCSSNLDCNYTAGEFCDSSNICQDYRSLVNITTGDNAVRIDKTSCSNNFTGFVPSALMYNELPVYLILRQEGKPLADRAVLLSHPQDIRYNLDGDNNFSVGIGEFQYVWDDYIDFDSSNDNFWIAFYNGIHPSQAGNNYSGGLFGYNVTLGGDEFVYPGYAKINLSGNDVQSIAETNPLIYHSGQCSANYFTNIPGCWQQSNGYWFTETPSSCNVVPVSVGAICGNGIIESGEECDDGNSIDTDACKNDCTLNSGSPPTTTPECSNHTSFNVSLKERVEIDYTYFYDSCNGTSNVFQVSCKDSSFYVNVSFSCPPETTCVDGACVRDIYPGGEVEEDPWWYFDWLFGWFWDFFDDEPSEQGDPWGFSCDDKELFINSLKNRLEDTYDELEYECIRNCIMYAEGYDSNWLTSMADFQNIIHEEGMGEMTCDEYGYSIEACNICDYDLGEGMSEEDSEFYGAFFGFIGEEIIPEDENGVPPLVEKKRDELKKEIEKMSPEMQAIYNELYGDLLN